MLIIRHYFAFDAFPASASVKSMLATLIRTDNECWLPLLVASSNKAVSTAPAGKCTYRTTLPRMKRCLTELWRTTMLAGLAQPGAMCKSATDEVRVVELVQDLDVLKLYVEELIDGFEGPFDGDVVFEFHGNFVVHEGFEEAVTLRCQRLF